MLHTHAGHLDYHPHVRLTVIWVELNLGTQQCPETKRGKVLFGAQNIVRDFRVRWFEAMRFACLHREGLMAAEWVVHLKERGHGAKARVCGPLSQSRCPAKETIIAETDGNVSFSFQDNQGIHLIRTLPGVEFLWILLK